MIDLYKVYVRIRSELKKKYGENCTLYFYVDNANTCFFEYMLRRENNALKSGYLFPAIVFNDEDVMGDNLVEQAVREITKRIDKVLVRS